MLRVDPDLRILDSSLWMAGIAAGYDG